MCVGDRSDREERRVIGCSCDMVRNLRFIHSLVCLSSIPGPSPKAMTMPKLKMTSMTPGAVTWASCMCVKCSVMTIVCTTHYALCRIMDLLSWT